MFVRPLSQLLQQRLLESPKHLQIIAGPRQVGKTTLVRQVLRLRPSASSMYVAADAPTSPEATAHLDEEAREAQVLDSTAPTVEWLRDAWAQAERQATSWGRSKHPDVDRLPFVFVVDEVQRVSRWSSLVKGLWDAGQGNRNRMHVVLLGSAPLLVQQGLTESLAGRYELIRMSHWSFEEMNDAFGFSLDQYVHFGGYPGSAQLIADEGRWRAYIRDALIDPSIERDVLAMSRVDKPAMLRRLFEIACDYSGQIVSLDNVSRTLGQGHTLTLAHHLVLLGQAGMLEGLQKYATQPIRRRKSPPKFQVHNNALMTAVTTYGFEEARVDRSYWGRLVESAVGAHLLATADADTRIHYWREADMEVDFIVEHLGRLAAIEVKSARGQQQHRGLDEFCRRHPDSRRWLVGSADLPLGDFLRQNASFWVR